MNRLSMLPRIQHAHFVSPFWLSCLLAMLLSACAGVSTFPGDNSTGSTVRAGATVALELGWVQNLTRQNMTVTVVDSAGTTTVYGPNDPHIRAIFNAYPDPVSNLIVGAQTGQSMGANATYAAALINYRTGSDPDWSQTTLLLDLPSPMANGLASITVAGPSGQMTPNPITLTIKGTVGIPSNFVSQTNGSVNSYLPLLERAPNYRVTFTGNAVPHSIQLTMAYTPGVGKAWIANPRGDIKNVIWTDNGSALQVMLAPANGVTPDNLLKFKFYVAGGVTNLTTTNVKAYNVNGNLISGITAQVSLQ